MARRLLAIPGSSAASERVFSLTSNILEDRRSSMSPLMLNCLLFVKSAIGWYEKQAEEGQLEGQQPEVVHVNDSDEED